MPTEVMLEAVPSVCGTISASKLCKQTTLMNYLVAAVAVSGGGIEDLKVLFNSIPADTDMAFIVVAPVPRDRESKLAEIVRRASKLPVIKADTSVEIQPGHIYVIAENSLLFVENEALVVRTRQRHEIANTAIKDLFMSVGANLKDRAVAVVLGGNGDSATFGATIIGKHGGYVICKQPDKLVNDEMTMNVIEGDSPNVILPLAEIADHLLSLGLKR
jgi:chemotaxis response regulator CheB